MIPPGGGEGPPNPVVADASLIVQSLTARDETGAWARRIVSAHRLVAPHILRCEVANALRRAEATERLTATEADRADRLLQRLPVDLVPYEPVSARVWALRHTLTPYDAWYVAVAERFGVPMATADHRLARAPGPNCHFLLPPAP